MNTDAHRLIEDIRKIISQARSLTRSRVNTLQVISNYLIGMRIVKEEQSGKERAEYGKATLKQLSAELTQEFGRGYSKRNLELMRKFYLTYLSVIEGKTQTVSAFFENGKNQTSSDQFFPQKSQILSEELSLTRISQTLSEKFLLSWSHYLFLMGISNIEERKFYELEAANGGWSLHMP